MQIGAILVRAGCAKEDGSAILAIFNKKDKLGAFGKAVDVMTMKGTGYTFVEVWQYDKDGFIELLYSWEHDKKMGWWASE